MQRDAFVKHLQLYMCLIVSLLSNNVSRKFHKCSTWIVNYL